MLIAIGLCIFAVVVAWEFFYSRRKGLEIYRTPALMSHVSLALGQQVINGVFLAASFGIYVLIQQKVGLFQIDSKNPWHWAVGFLLADLCWYVAHRLGHRVNLLIAPHSVHHHTQDFNHGSALRQSWTNRPVQLFFFSPMPILGFHPEMILAIVGINTFIQFFSHNGVFLRSFGFIDKIIVTPRSHKTHHGINRPYLDKNFGGVFMFWDVLFGTYQPVIPEIPVEIGSMKPVDIYHPATAHSDYFRQILLVARHRQGLHRKIAIFFQTPEVLAAELEALGPQLFDRPALPQERNLSKSFVIFYSISLAVLIACYFTLVSSLGQELPTQIRFPAAAAIIVTIILLGKALSQRVYGTPDGAFEMKQIFRRPLPIKKLLSARLMILMAFLFSAVAVKAMAHEEYTEHSVSLRSGTESKN